MEEKDIIRALDLCSLDSYGCGACPYKDISGCRFEVIAGARDIISALQSKLEVYAETMEQLESDISNANMNLDHVTKELERAQKTCVDMFPRVCNGCQETNCDTCSWRETVNEYSKNLVTINCNRCVHLPLCMYIFDKDSEFKFPCEGGHCEMFMWI